ncbi:MAG: hypothetical protein XE10_2086 [Methanoculleus marisnigri]|jgi:hypothetical protein|uniref:Uncharacterized protein n=1 Tax=Methanoculleus marisnigri TaxID=2198 RepID=A0A101INA3_9EURY|nr:MAG: hypothetical protein XE10_2086 [Methanoculleus marisnigri]
MRMAPERTALALALTAAYFIAVPVTGMYARFAYNGQSVYRVADLAPVLLLFCIISLAGAVLCAAAMREEDGRWWAAVPLAALLLALAVFGPSPWSSGSGLLATVLLAPAALILLLGALPVRMGTFAWFSAIETGIISLFGLVWAYGLFLAPPLPENVRVDSPSLYEFAGAAYVYAGLGLLGILLLVLACRQTPVEERAA